MRSLLLILAAVVLAVVPAGAEELEWVPNLVRDQVWFACGSSKVTPDNAAGNAATWDREAPTQSVTSGAGCGTIDSPFYQTAQPNLYDAAWSGTFTGNLDTLNVELHNIYVGPGRATGQLASSVRLFVDGEPLFAEELGRDATFPAVRSSSGASEKIQFSIRNIGFVAEAENIEHTVLLMMSSGTALNRGPTVNDTLSGWVWDTTEVPSGITFNPETLHPTVLEAARQVY
jgi:hypothetical protein